jgi:predicted secreted protein
VEVFRFEAVEAGETLIELVYHRPWEEGVEPLETFSIQVIVR